MALDSRRRKSHSAAVAALYSAAVAALRLVTANQVHPGTLCQPMGPQGFKKYPRETPQGLHGTSQVCDQTSRPAPRGPVSRSGHKLVTQSCPKGDPDATKTVPKRVTNFCHPFWVKMVPPLRRSASSITCKNHGQRVPDGSKKGAMPESLLGSPWAGARGRRWEPK